MPLFKLPLSGDVTQSILPWTFAPMGGQWGLVNITLGQSTAPEVEADVLTDVAGYGKQLGRIADVVNVLLKHVPKNIPATDAKAIADFRDMLEGIEMVKKRHGRSAPNAPGRVTAST